MRPILLGAFIVVAMSASGYGGYYYGYREGSSRVFTPPISILNADTIADSSLALSDPGQSVDFKPFWQTWYILEKNFSPASTTDYNASTSRARLVGAIAGLAGAYGDPYTVFIPKAEAEAFKEQVNGEFEGIGAALSAEGGVITITAILPNSPAEAAGMQKGWLILAVNGEPTVGQGLESIIPRIRGPKGSSVVLTVAKDDTGAPSDLTITRESVAIPTTATRVVSASKDAIKAALAKTRAAAVAAGAAASTLLSEEEEEVLAQKQQFFVLQLVQFARTSIDAFIADLEKFAKSDTPNLIIDLRNNPGGYMDVAVDLASYFLPKDTLVVTQRTGTDASQQEYRTVSHQVLENIEKRRIVVLLNRNSASASEILAGALQDHGVAKIVGEKSFGKGSVQTLVDIGDLGSLKVTISRWYTPQGRNISNGGITPDVEIDLTDPKYASSTDPFIDLATEVLLDDSLWK